jgi:NTP pyrophosphatase (non-canonical NTP hydrolase)
MPTAGNSESQIQQTLDILQEECAEAIVEVSKVRRFGFDGTHYKTGIRHRTHLAMELGDVLAMIDILVEQGVVERQELENFATQKKHKLTQWSSIYED